ncbi:MAG: N-acetylglutamate synthase [Mycobacterium sp.]|jgi:hypothetical protein|nr:N-acetylglutamate synthase [Mycobacterium sp.]
MISWPELGTRVAVRYRRPAGSVPPLTDAVGHLQAVHPMVRVRTKTGAVVEFAPADAVALRVLTDVPVRTSQIRALEHAAAVGRPGVEQAWLYGWLLRAGHGADIESNSALPLDISANTTAIPAIVAWYTHRGLVPQLAIPDRLLRPPAGLAPEREDRMLVRDVRELSAPRELEASPESYAGVTFDKESHASVTFAAVVDGEVVFGADPDVAGARAVVTVAPDGTRWVGLSAIRTLAGPAGPLCEALLAWGASRGATRAYLRVGDRDTHTSALAESLGFRLHHRSRYFPVPSGTWDSV